MNKCTLTKQTFFVGTVAAILVLISLNVLGCGCGMALAPPEVFNSMKESQAYLLVDVTGPNSYTEKPFFRFVSLDKEYDVKMIFPMKEQPSSVDGKKLSIKEFLEIEKITAAKTEEKKQTLAGVVDAVRKPLIIPAMLSGAGVAGSFIALLSSGLGSFGAGAPKAVHYSFEGGELDIYDVSSQKTLEALVKELGFDAQGKVKELVDKYNGYYVAVMTLHVPTALPQPQMDYLKNSCSQKFEAAKSLLRTKSTIEWKELGINPYDAAQVASGRSNLESCDRDIVALVSSATNPSSDVKGVLISMSYTGKEIFYPTSIVNSYTYPVTDQAYYVRTPFDLQFTPQTDVAGKILLDGKRWYIIKDTSKDMAGTIEPATAQTKAEDSWLAMLKAAFESAGWIAFVVFIIILGIAGYFISRLPKTELPSTTNLIVITLLGGVIIAAIYSFIKGKRKLAGILLFTWIILLLLAIL